MTDKQPEALRLAYVLEQGHDLRDEEEAAAELRRLHEVNAELVEALREMVEWSTWQNAALRLGEELSTVGPDGYYNMTARQWLDWAMKNVTPARLTQPEPKPVAWTVGGLITDFSRDFSAYKTKAYTRPLYTAPPQREWQGLTDEEVTACWKDGFDSCEQKTVADLRDFIARAIEAKLKEKNT